MKVVFYLSLLCFAGTPGADSLAHSEATAVQSAQSEVLAAPRRLDNFPQDLFTTEQQENGAVTLHLLGMIYMFLALAIIVGEFLQCLSHGDV